MSVIHYFAYGSNLHPLRLQRRIPSAQFIGTAVITGYELNFVKRGRDDSGKGHIKSVSHPSQVHGAVYQIAAEHKQDLDKFEGAGYAHTRLELSVSGSGYSCFAYQGITSHLDENLHPFHWYKSLIVIGAQFHGFPAAYIERIQRTPSNQDPDPQRRSMHEQLIKDMQDFSAD